jgi:hypothetical protein
MPPDDNLSLYLCQTACKTVQLDLNAGNLSVAQTDLGKAQGYRNSILDSGIQAQADASLTQATAAVQSATPAQLATNQAAWDQQAADVQANVAALNADETYQAAAAAENAQIQAGATALAEGKDPALAYNSIPDPLGIGTALNVSGQSPNPGVAGLSLGGLAALGGTTAVIAIVVLGVALVWAKSARII